MDISNYVASVSMAMSQTAVRQAVGIALANKIMDTQEQQAILLNDLIMSPPTGRMIDIRA